QNGVHERVEVHAHEVDLPQSLLREGLHVLGAISPREDARVHAWVQRLDAAVHHLREAGEVADRPRVDGRVLDGAKRAARREELVAEPAEAAREGGEPSLVANGQYGCRQACPPSTGFPAAGSGAPLPALAGAGSPPYPLRGSAPPP